MSTVTPWVSDVFDSVLARAMHKDPARRFPSISQFAFALESAAARANLADEPLDEATTWGDESPAESAPTFASGVVVPAPDEIASKAPTRSFPRRTRGTAPMGSPEDPREPSPAATLFAEVEKALGSGKLTVAVQRAEQLLDLAARDAHPEVADILARAMPTIDDVFRRYVGPLDGCIQAGPAYASLRGMQLSPRSAELLGLMDQPTPIAEVFRATKIPERAGIRLVAGLLSRRVVERTDTPRS